MSSVLITGGTGFIGSWVTRQLVEQGRRVVSYSRHPDTMFIKDIVDKVDLVAGDVLELPSLIHTIRDYEVERVIHTSTLLGNPLETNPFMGYRVNVDGTLNVFEACRFMGVKRVVYISSKAVYDIARGEHAHPTYKPIDEEYTKEPNLVYGAIKFFMENMGSCYHRVYGLDFVALRFATTLGPAKQYRHRFAASSKIIESAMLGQPLKIPQGGDQMDDMIYVKDIANSMVLACFAENLEHRIFHVGTGKGETFRHLVEILNKILGPVPIEVGPGLGAASGSNYSVFNIDRARRELGYSPQYDLEASVRDYIEMMKRLDISPVVLS